MLGLAYESSKEVYLHGYTDSDYATDKSDRKSTTGYAFFVNKNLVSWVSQKQPTVAMSSTEAEYIALAAAAREAVWLPKLLEELGFPQENPTVICVDNQSTLKLAKNPELHKRTKHIDIKYHYTRNLIQDGQISLQYVPSSENTADILTKPLLKSKHMMMKEKLGMKEKEPTIESKNHGPISRKLSLKSMWTLTTLLCLCFMMPCYGITQNSQPVLWRPSPIPVTEGYYRVNFKVTLISPCEAITRDVIHDDLVKQAKEQGEKMYQEMLKN